MVLIIVLLKLIDMLHSSVRIVCTIAATRIGDEEFDDPLNTFGIIGINPVTSTGSEMASLEDNELCILVARFLNRRVSYDLKEFLSFF